MNEQAQQILLCSLLIIHARSLESRVDPKKAVVKSETDIIFVLFYLILLKTSEIRKYFVSR